MRPALILFDVDGTLVDTAGAGRRGLCRSFVEVFGVKDVEEKVAGVRLNGRTDPTIIAEFAQSAGVAPGALESRYGDLQRAYLAALREELVAAHARRRVLPGVQALLDALAGRPGISLGLVTGNIEDGARAKLEVFGLNAYFADGGFSSDHPERAEIARIAHERFCRRAAHRFAPDQVTVVGDTELDVACARANGFRAVGVSAREEDRGAMAAARPDALFADLTPLDEVLRALDVVPRA